MARRMDIGLAAGLGAALICAAVLAPAARAEEPLAHGQAIVTEDCGGCHAVGSDGDSPLEKAPRFRELARKFPIEGLAEALAEGIMTGHPEMPERSYEPSDIDAILAYLESIQVKE